MKLGLRSRLVLIWKHFFLVCVDMIFGDGASEQYLNPSDKGIFIFVYLVPVPSKNTEKNSKKGSTEDLNPSTQGTLWFFSME